MTVSSSVVRAFTLGFSEDISSMSCRHCNALPSTTSSSSSSSTGSSEANAGVGSVDASTVVCEPAVACDADTGSVVAVAAAEDGGSLVLSEDRTALVLCQRAVASGCDVASLSLPTANEDRACPLGALRECGLQQLSFARACNAFTGTQFRACVQDNTYIHWVEVTLEDTAGNTAASIVDSWVLGQCVCMCVCVC